MPCAFAALLWVSTAGCGARGEPGSADAATDDAGAGGGCQGCAGRCCQGQCSDVMTDAHNCGACGRACADGMQCLSGTCQCVPPGGQGARSCGAGEACCDGQCTSIQSDPRHCGACATDCTAGGTLAQACFKGQCGCGMAGKRCEAGQSCCGDGCVDVMTDASHCGQCGKPCPPGIFCKGGKCDLPPDCGGKTCLPEEKCDRGICIPVRPCDMPCAWGDGCVFTQGKWQCVTGACQTDRECPPGKKCMPVFVLGFGFCM